MSTALQGPNVIGQTSQEPLPKGGKGPILPQQKYVWWDVRPPTLWRIYYTAVIFFQKGRKYKHFAPLQTSTCPLQKEQFNRKYHLPTMEFSGDGGYCNTTQKKTTPLNKELDLNRFQQNPDHQLLPFVTLWYPKWIRHVFTPEKDHKSNTL